MARLPYFPLNAREYLLDDDISVLEPEEEGFLIRLWCHMWINKYKRGHLLSDKKTPISDQNLAKKLKITPEKFKKVKEKFLDLKLMRLGKYDELFSRRQSNYKTQYEIYEKPSSKHSGKKLKPSGNHQGTFRERSEQNRIELELNGIELEVLRKEKDKDAELGSAKLSTSQQKEKISHIVDSIVEGKDVNKAEDGEVLKVRTAWVDHFKDSKGFEWGVVKKMLRGEGYSLMTVEKLVGIISQMDSREQKMGTLKDRKARFIDMVVKYPVYAP